MKNYRQVKITRLDIIILIGWFRIIILLSYIGSPYMWQNKREKQVAIFSRLDRDLTNHLSVNTYPYYVVKHLPIFCSNHASILLDTSIPGNIKSRCSFKFEAKWLLHNDCLVLVNLFGLITFRNFTLINSHKNPICLNRLLKIGSMKRIGSW